MSGNQIKSQMNAAGSSNLFQKLKETLEKAQQAQSTTTIADSPIGSRNDIAPPPKAAPTEASPDPVQVQQAPRPEVTPKVNPFSRDIGHPSKMKIERWDQTSEVGTEDEGQSAQLAEQSLKPRWSRCVLSHPAMALQQADQR